MRDYVGSPFTRLPPEFRAAIAPLDYWARDASKGFARIQNGEVPSGSGSPLPGTLAIPDDPGAILFVGAGPVLDTDPDALFWDDTNNRLGIGTASPQAVLHLRQPVPIQTFQSTSDGADWTLQSGGGANTRWAIADVSGSFSTAFQSLATNDGETGFVFINNAVSGAFPFASTSVMPTMTASLGTIWTINTVVKLTTAYAGNVTFFMDLHLSDGNVYRTATHNIRDTATPGSFVTLSFNVDTSLGPFTTGTANRVVFRSTDPSAAGFAPGFYITYMDVQVGAGSGSDIVRWDGTDGSTMVGRITKDGYVETPRLQLTGSTSGTLTHAPAATTTSHTLTWPSAQGAANTFLLNNGSGALSWSTLGAVGGDFLDSLFRIVDNGDTTKKIAFEASGITAGNTRTLTAPNASGTLAILSLAQTFSAAQIFDVSAVAAVPVTVSHDAGNTTDFFQAFEDAALGFTVSYLGEINTASDAPLRMWFGSGSINTGDPVLMSFANVGAAAGGTTVNFPVSTAATVTIVTTAGTQTLTNKTITALAVASSFNSSTASSGVNFQDSSTNTKKLRMVLSGAVGNNSFTLSNTAARNYGFGDLSGSLVVVGDDPPAVASGALGKVDLTAQTAAIGATNLTNAPPAGLYRVSYYLAVTTADAGAGSVQFQINYTDVIGATNQTGAALVLTAQGRQSGTFVAQLASGDLSYQTNVVTIGTAQWALYVRVESLG